ncbi:MAG: zinc ribbon domain-containing protein [Methanobrevibacter sp.]|nr:zinc ribbon domain-containing protein [Methanobrevibacter sp.]
MKKCPECGNPSYDGAPVCGNCGYKFPKPKVAPAKREDIFKEKPKTKKSSNDESVIKIIKENKVIIGTILIITIIVILGIVLTAPGNNNSSSNNNGLKEYTAGDFSFKYPGKWEELNLTDQENSGAKFFKNENNTNIEFYQTSSDSPSLKAITQERISYAQGNNGYVELVETITLDGRNSSNVIIENSDGNYTRFVSMFSDKQVYTFKITGDSINSVTSPDVTDMINSADIA